MFQVGAGISSRAFLLPQSEGKMDTGYKLALLVIANDQEVGEVHSLLETLTAGKFPEGSDVQCSVTSFSLEPNVVPPAGTLEELVCQLVDHIEERRG